MPQQTRQRARRRPIQRTMAATQVQLNIASQIPFDRREEILEYLKLFGYKPDKTVLQVYLPGHFGKGVVSQKQAEKRSNDVKRYGATTFVVVGRTHDPSLEQILLKPKSQSNPGYLGYLWKGKNYRGKPPHELLPPDFTPVNLKYPNDWREVFANRGFIVALHVPASLAQRKNKITRALYHRGRDFDVRDHWNFIDDVKREIGLDAR